MNKLALASTAAPGLPDQTQTQASAAALTPAEPARTAPLSRRFVLVEDVDYLTRTGRSRQVLAARWVD